MPNPEIVRTWSRRPGNREIKGFSVTEMIVVLALIGILSIISIPYIYSYKTKYKTEDQALKVMDLMREAGQLAMTRRRTVRFEIDLTDNAALLIVENGTGPGTLIKSIPLEQKSEVRVDVKPDGITRPSPTNYNDAAFGSDSLGHKRGTATVSGHQVWAARFRSDGSVVNAAGKLTSANLYFWPPLAVGNTLPRTKSEVRAVTIFGGSGAMRYWKHDGTAFKPY